MEQNKFDSVEEVLEENTEKTDTVSGVNEEKYRLFTHKTEGLPGTNRDQIGDKIKFSEKFSLQRYNLPSFFVSLRPKYRDNIN